MCQCPLTTHNPPGVKSKCFSCNAAQDIDFNERVEAAPKQRISIYCIAESLDRKLLEKKLEARGSRFLVRQYPDVLYGQYYSLESGAPQGDM